MQTTKEYISKQLQETACDAFLRKGFKAVSMREISSLSGIGLSNIYNYYPSKNDLLAVVLSPLLKKMNSLLDNHNRNENLSLEVFVSEEYHRKYVLEVMDIITCYRKELKLLFLNTQGSRFEDYSERWIDKSTAIGEKYMERMKILYPDLHTNISLFFIHFTSSWWINMMREVALHEELSHEEIERFIREFVHYSTGGWKKLMKVDDEGRTIEGGIISFDSEKKLDKEQVITKYESNDRKHSQAVEV